MKEENKIHYNKMPTEWISHVKKTQQEKGCSYSEALSHASKTWKKKTKEIKKTPVE